MDRFSWADGVIYPYENIVRQHKGVRIYNGDEKTSFESGNVILTTHRLIWRDEKDQNCVLSLTHSYVIYLEEQSSGIGRSAKVIVHLKAASSDHIAGPVTQSRHSYVKLSFREGGQSEFYRCYQMELSKKTWEIQTQPVATASAPAPQARKTRTGIVGIERHRKEKHKQTDTHITQAFEDLSKLIEKAKEMVNLSKVITDKIKAKQGAISDDETVKFKSYLMSLGISDPVTRDTHGSGDKYYQELAKQISKTLETPLGECGGLMTLTDVYCRINRARGMELLSPDDLVCACREMEYLHLPVRLRIFDSGVMVLQLATHSDEQTVTITTKIVEDKGSITAEELANAIGLSVTLAKERLLTTEKVGGVCRDESVEGLRFYPNLFLTV